MDGRTWTTITVPAVNSYRDRFGISIEPTLQIQCSEREGSHEYQVILNSGTLATPSPEFARVRVKLDSDQAEEHIWYVRSDYRSYLYAYPDEKAVEDYDLKANTIAFLAALRTAKVMLIEIQPFLLGHLDVVKFLLGQLPSAIRGASECRAEKSVRPSRTSSLAINTFPNGARARLDHEDEISCTTPCSLTLQSGHHLITIEKSGFETQSKEVDVSEGTPEDLERTFVLKRTSATLMLSSEPSGAAIWVDDEPTAGRTPAEIELSYGTHKIAVEHDGKRASKTVEILPGINYERIRIPAKIILLKPR